MSVNNQLITLNTNVTSVKDLISLQSKLYVNWVPVHGADKTPGGVVPIKQ